MQVQAATGSYTQASRFAILTAAGGVSGTFAGFSVNQTLRLPHAADHLFYDANDTIFGFSLTQVTTPTGPAPIAFPSVAVTRIQASTAAAVQALGLGNPVYNAVVGQTVAGARQAFDGLSGEVHASAVTAG